MKRSSVNGFFELEVSTFGSADGALLLASYVAFEVGSETRFTHRDVTALHVDHRGLAIKTQLADLVITFSIFYLFTLLLFFLFLLFL